MRQLFIVISALISLMSFAEDREVVIANPSEGSVLAGTLSMPSSRPKAALVLATGSGQQDRDETVFGHKPFKVIADTLCSAGYVVLRLDDRGVGGSTGEVEKATTANFVSDISRAVNWLDSALIDVPVGVLGHSEGGQIAYRVAVADTACSFIITLAAPAWRGDSLVMAQCRAIAVNSLGRWDGEKNQRAILDIVMSDLPTYVAKPIILGELAKAMGDASKMPQIQEYMTTQADLVLCPWYRDFIRFDPTETIASVGVPWLALNGEKDTQVPPANLLTIVEHCPSVTAIELPGHNHLFQHSSTGLPNEYAQIEEDISVDTLAAILDWLDKLSSGNNSN